MKAFLFGLLLGIVFVPAAFYYYMRSGKAPVATSEPPMPLEETLTNAALHARLRQAAPSMAPIKGNEAALLAGVTVYRENCAMCHGLPDRPAPVVAKGMFPHPPQLFQGEEMVTDDPAGVTFWKAKNGIRLSGMPSFRAALSDEQLWQVSLLLAGADKLPASVQHALGAPSASEAAPK